ncbi:MAG: Gfo/Idh/MocA family oxidoreductase [Candidatus Micrarchaeota archaeon]|nr:Gfo/Idh/MocA family oxidoreductase [Candidatus Micrarchaeota archaeon]
MPGVAAMLDYCIVGLGNIAEKAYLKATGTTRGARLAGVCDIIPERAERWGAETGRPCYTDLEQMLDETDPDFVIDCTPHNVHREVIEAACRRGTHVLKEKPFARSLDEARQIDEMSRRSGIMVMIALQRRFNGIHRRFAELRGSINPFLIECRYSAYISSPGSGWRGTREQAGGGCVIDMGYHMIDLLIWYFGLPSMVCAEFSAAAVPSGAYDAEDTAAIMFNYGRGLYGSLTLSRFAPRTEYMRATGSNGILEVTKDELRYMKNDGTMMEQTRQEFDMPKLVAEEIDYFAGVINGEEQNFSGTEQNLGHMSFIDACYKSRESGVYQRIDGRVH